MGRLEFGCQAFDRLAGRRVSFGYKLKGCEILWGVIPGIRARARKLPCSMVQCNALDALSLLDLDVRVYTCWENQTAVSKP